MSEVRPEREWRFYVEDMIAFCDKVVAYTRDLDRASFALDAMRYDATLRNLELIGGQRPMCRPRCVLLLQIFHGAWSSPCETD